MDSSKRIFQDLETQIHRNKGDEKIFVTNVEESTDICSKEKGMHTI